MRPDWWFLCNLTGIFDKIQLIGLVLGCRQFYLSYTCCVRCSAIMNTWKLPLCKSVFWNKQMAHTLQCCEFYFYMHVMEEVTKNFDTKNTSLTYPMQRKVKRKWWEICLWRRQLYRLWHCEWVSGKDMDGSAVSELSLWWSRLYKSFCLPSHLENVTYPELLRHSGYPWNLVCCHSKIVLQSWQQREIQKLHLA